MNTLVMTFLNKDNKKYSLRIPKVRTDVLETEVTELMNFIITKNLFFTELKELVSIETASISREENLF